MADYSQPAQPNVLYSHRWQRVAGIVLVLLAGLLYAITLDDGLQPGELLGGDLITHQYAQVQARPSNAPGYPLYTMGGWLWFHSMQAMLSVGGHALPNPLPILSSYSTFWALIALWLLYEISCRVTRSPRWPAGNWPLAALLAAFYAVTYFFWYYATTTEQYTSAIAQTLAIVFVYLLWQGRGARGDSRQDRLLLLLAFLCGLALAHMVTVAFIVPPLVAVVLWTQPSLLRRPTMIAATIAAALAPLLAYVYVYLRGAANPAWWGAGPWPDANTWFWAFVSTAQGRAELAWGFQPTCAFFANGFPALIWGELSLPFVLLGIAGVTLLPHRLPWILYPTLAIYLVFDWMYRCGNWYQVILPAYPLLLLGVVAVLNRMEDRLARSRYSHLRWAVALLLVVAVMWRFDGSWARADSRNRAEDTGLARPAILLDQPLPANVALFAAVADALGLDYLVNIWGIRADLRLVSSTTAADVLRAGRPLLTTFDAAPLLLAELPADLAPVGQTFSADWLALSLTPIAPTVAISVELNLPVTDGVTLLGYTVTPAPTGAPVASSSPAVDVTLAWRLDEAWPANLGVSLRPTRSGALITAPTGAIIQQDAGAPGQGLAPTKGVAVDAQRVPMPSGADGVTLIVYRTTESGFENLLERALIVHHLAE